MQTCPEFWNAPAKRSAATFFGSVVQHRIKGFLEDAHKKGTVIVGGSVMDRPGYFVEATIVRDIKEGSRLLDEEQFGPVLPVIKFSETEDVIRRAYATSYGLGASV
jgi:acyl-CoA reductase-like NAD-dependent aldehyde dehydrogenase